MFLIITTTCVVEAFRAASVWRRHGAQRTRAVRGGLRKEGQLADQGGLPRIWTSRRKRAAKDPTLVQRN